MQRPCLGTAAVDRDLERLERESAIVDRTDRPADHEPGVQVEYRGEIEPAAFADHELRRVADPALIGGGRRELAVQDVGRDEVLVSSLRKIGPSVHRSKPTSRL